MIGFECQLFDTLLLLEPVMKSGSCALDDLKYFAHNLFVQLRSCVILFLNFFFFFFGLNIFFFLRQGWLNAHSQLNPNEDSSSVCQSLFLHRVFSMVVRSSCLGHHKAKLQDVCPALTENPKLVRRKDSILLISHKKP